jgi:hypothetical protein
VAVIPTGVFADTGTVEIGKVAVDAPPRTVTGPETDTTAGLALATVTEIPPLGAGPLSVIVPVDPFPPRTLVGNRVSNDGVGAFTAKVTVLEPLYVAVIPTGVAADTGTVVIGKVAMDAPPATVTVAGTVATTALPLASVTVTPAVGATPDKVTVPVEPFPPIKVDGSSDTLRTAGGFTVRETVLLTPKVAVIAVSVAVDTGTEAIRNVAEVAPASIFTVAGGATAAVLLPSETATPPDGAGPVRVMVAEVLFPQLKRSQRAQTLTALAD